MLNSMYYDVRKTECRKEVINMRLALPDMKCTKSTIPLQYSTRKTPKKKQSPNRCGICAVKQGIKRGS